MTVVELIAHLSDLATDPEIRNLQVSMVIDTSDIQVERVVNEVVVSTLLRKKGTHVSIPQKVVLLPEDFS